MHKNQSLLDFIQDSLKDMKAENIQVLPVDQITSIADYMVIATGTSSIHTRSIADRLIEKAKAQGVHILSSEGQRQANWVLIDFGEVIVHIMQGSARDYYQLEKLWSIQE